MTTLKKLLVVTGVTFVVLSRMGAARAVNVTIGADESENCIPFSSCSPNTQYQQVYNALAFSDPIEINEVIFFTAPEFGSIVLDTANYLITLSTTNKSVGGLSSDLSSNIGGDNKVFFTGLLSGSVSETELTITGNSFVYNPSQGNLLLNIIKSSSLNNGQGYFQAGFSNDTSRIGNDFSTPDIGSYGLKTEFGGNPTTVPEPTTTIGLLTAGALGTAWKRKYGQKKGL